MKTGGREALLGLLLKRDISKFNAEAIPATKERELQKILSAPPGDRIIIGFARTAGYLAQRHALTLPGHTTASTARTDCIQP